MRPRKQVNMQNAALWFVALMALLVYFGGYTRSFFTRQRVATAEVTMGGLAETYAFSGVAVRSETVYRAAASGAVVAVVAEGERARKGGVVCAVQDAGGVAELEAGLAKVDSSILATETDAAPSMFDADVAAVDARIRRLADDAAFSLSEGKVQALYTLKEKVSRELETRRQILRVGAKGDAAALARERALYESQLAAARHGVTAAESGLVSYTLDGMEAALAAANIDAIGAAQARMKPDAIAATHVAEVAIGDPVCRVVTSNTWYIAAWCADARAAGDWEEGGRYTVDAQANPAAPAKPLETRVRTLREEDGGVFILFEMNHSLDDYLDARALTVTVSHGQVDGLKIPNSAIVEKTLLGVPAACVTKRDDRRYITKLNAAGKREESVITVTDESEDKKTLYIIQDYNNVRFGDTLYTEDGAAIRLDDARSIEGVFIANTGAPAFRPISRGGDSAASEGYTGYTVLDPAYNRRVKAHDKIVLDARRLDEGQLVY